jgi:hypothetical protein
MAVRNWGRQQAQCSSPGRYMGAYEAAVEWYDTGKKKNSERNLYQNHPLSTISPTLTALGVNPGLCGQNSATNLFELHHGHRPTLQILLMVFLG